MQYRTIPVSSALLQFTATFAASKVKYGSISHFNDDKTELLLPLIVNIIIRRKIVVVINVGKGVREKVKSSL